VVVVAVGPSRVGVGVEVSSGAWAKAPLGRARNVATTRLPRVTTSETTTLTT
jgi:hypothetical protein